MRLYRKGIDGMRSYAASKVLFLKRFDITLFYFTYFRNLVETSIFNTILDIVLIILLVLYIINRSLQLYVVFKETRGG